MRRTFILGDIHGAFRALKQCLEKASFDYENDRLIALGDVCDGWPETRQAVDELMKIKNLIYILGNHDMIMLHWMETGMIAENWFKHGGETTYNSYRDDIPTSHIDFLKKSTYYHLENNRLFVHAGILTDRGLDAQGPSVFMWDRTLASRVTDLYNQGIYDNVTAYDEIYIGHTPIASPNPVKYCEVWMMDTGAGWAGPLSLMNVDTKEFFISDPVTSLYPGVQGRTK